jgi:hypothetical protein
MQRLARLAALLPTWSEKVALVAVLALSWLAWSTAARSPSTTPVLVYLANETRPSPAGAHNLEVVSGWLCAAGDASATAAAASLVRDRVQFPAAVDRDFAALREQGKIAAFVATNESVRRGAVWLRQQPGRGLGTDLAFAAPTASGDPVVDDNPLAQRDVLRRVLAVVGMRFPADRHHVVLVVKSHGVDDLVLTPRLTVRHASSSAGEVLARVRGTSQPGRHLDGVSRKELFAELRDSGLHVALLVLEVCGGGAELEIASLPANVQAVAAGAGTVGYENLDLGRLDGDLVQQVRDQLAGSADLQILAAADPRRWSLLAPLVMLAVIAGRSLGRFRRLRGTEAPAARGSAS